MQLLNVAYGDATLTDEHAVSCHGVPVIVIDGVAYGPTDRNFMFTCSGSDPERSYWQGVPLTLDEQRLADESWEIAGPYEHSWLTDAEYALLRAARAAGYHAEERATKGVQS